MPSPFPGMDPYLEDRALWREFHTWFITSAASQLQPRLLERGYRVSVEGRVWMEDPDQLIYPDVSIWTRVERPARDDSAVPAEDADSPLLVCIPPLKVKEHFLEIRQIGSRRLVTAIELLSPTNKEVPKARAKYVRKRKELRSAQVSLVEIDLLRSGESLVAVPPEAIAPREGDHYLVDVIRAGSPHLEVYPIPLRDRLPRLRVPLSRGEADIVLDLQAALARSYDEGGLSAEIDYNLPPRPPLSRGDEAWADAILIERGVRRPPSRP